MTSAEQTRRIRDEIARERQQVMGGDGQTQQQGDNTTGSSPSQAEQGGSALDPKEKPRRHGPRQRPQNPDKD